MLKMLGDEVRLCMGLAGVTTVKEITKDYLVKVSNQSAMLPPHEILTLYRWIEADLYQSCEPIVRCTVFYLPLYSTCPLLVSTCFRFVS